MASTAFVFTVHLLYQARTCCYCIEAINFVFIAKGFDVGSTFLTLNELKLMEISRRDRTGSSGLHL